MKYFNLFFFFFFGVMRQQRQCRRGSAFALLNGCTPPPCRIPSKAPTHVPFLFFFFRVGCHLRITLLSLSLFSFFFLKTVSALVLRYTNTSDICNLPFFLFFFFLTLLFLRYANSFLFFFLFSSSLTLPPSSSLQHPEFFFFFFCVVVWVCGGCIYLK